MSRLRLIASDFFVSFLWVWSGSLLRCLAFRILGDRNSPGILIIKASIAVPYLVFFAWLGRATKGGSYNPLVVLCYAISGDFVVFLFSILARIPAQVVGSVIGVLLTNSTFPGEFHGPRGPRLNVDINRGTFTEGLLTFMIVIIVLSLKKKDLGNSAIRTWISSASKVILHLLGSDITGGIMNPATHSSSSASMEFNKKIPTALVLFSILVAASNIDSTLACTHTWAASSTFQGNCKTSKCKDACLAEQPDFIDGQCSGFIFNKYCKCALKCL